MKFHAVFNAIMPDGETLITEGETPFFPHIGDMLSVTPGGDFLSVEEVFWSCRTPAQIEVYLSTPEVEEEFQASTMLAQGWKKEGGHAQPA